MALLFFSLSCGQHVFFVFFSYFDSVGRERSQSLALPGRSWQNWRREIWFVRVKAIIQPNTFKVWPSSFRTAAPGSLFGRDSGNVGRVGQVVKYGSGMSKRGLVLNIRKIHYPVAINKNYNPPLLFNFTVQLIAVLIPSLRWVDRNASRYKKNKVFFFFSRCPRGPLSRQKKVTTIYFFIIINLYLVEARSINTL